MTIAQAPVPLWRVPQHTRRDLPESLLFAGFAALAAINWWLAALLPSQLFSWSSLLLFGVLLALVMRVSTIGFVLLLPFVLTRLATTLSLIAIEAGAYMPEVNRAGAPGDASASFVAITAIWFVAFALIVRAFAPYALRYTRSDLLDRIVRLLIWPAIALCVAWGALSFLEGLRSGFPLLAGVDRFLYRRVYSGPFSLTLLDNKFLVAAILGTICLGPYRTRASSPIAALTFVALLALFFLFGDKFFTILTSMVFFLMPWLLRRHDRLGRTLLRLMPAAAALVMLSGAATIYIYSGYGRLPLDRTLTSVGERVAGQGELWFVASRDDRDVARWDAQLVHRNLVTLDDKSPPTSAFAQGIETYYFVQRYAPAALARSFQHNAGWVQLTMGTEALALVMFGYVGTVVVMLVGACLAAFVALYLLRTFATGFAISVALAVWTYLQVYIAMQQASFWSVAAPGQAKRLLLFLTLEIVLLAINRGGRRVSGRKSPLTMAAARS